MPSLSSRCASPPRCQKQCVAARVYPGRKDSVGVSIQSVGREAQVLEHGRGDKVIVYKRKRRKGYEKKMGHRQDYTRIEVTGFKKG